MARKAGLGEVATLRTDRHESSVVQTMHSGTIGQMAPVEEIAVNPRNPKARVEHLEDLIPRIQRRGILTPVLLTPAAEWLDKRPEDAAWVGGKPWVLYDGHRRLATARHLGLAHVPYFLRAPDIDEALVRLDTNQGLKLTPIEEALQYRYLADSAGMSQQTIAEETGVTQSYVAQRLKLLTLPEPIQDAIGAGLIDVGSARDLAYTKDTDLVGRVGEHVATRRALFEDPADADALDESTPDVPEPRKIDLRATIRQVTQERDVERGRELAQAEAAQLGAEYCDDLEARLGAAPFQHRIYDSATIKRAAAAGNLLVVPTASQPSFYLIQPESAVPDREKAQAAERRRAKDARYGALTTAAVTKVNAATIQDALVTMAIHGLALGGKASELAYELACHTGMSATGIGDFTWRRQLAEASEGQQLRFAWLICLAVFETHTRSERLAWGGIQRHYFALLREVSGYVPTSWEQDQLDVIDAGGKE